jgi:hypothetical protein
MKKYYLVYRCSFDSDFDNCPSNYILGLYDDEIKAKEICDKDFCKKTYYQELKTNQEVFIKL